jgi:hypothetical protein
MLKIENDKSDPRTQAEVDLTYRQLERTRVTQQGNCSNYSMASFEIQWYFGLGVFRFQGGLYSRHKKA